MSSSGSSWTKTIIKIYEYKIVTKWHFLWYIFEKVYFKSGKTICVYINISCKETVVITIPISPSEMIAESSLHERDN